MGTKVARVGIQFEITVSIAGHSGRLQWCGGKSEPGMTVRNVQESTPRDASPRILPRYSFGTVDQLIYSGGLQKWPPTGDWQLY